MSKKFTRIMAVLMSILMIITVLPTEYLLSYAFDADDNTISFVDTGDSEIEISGDTATIHARTYKKEYELKYQFRYAIDYSTNESYAPGQMIYMLPSLGFYDNGVTAGNIMPTDIAVNNNGSDIWEYEETMQGSHQVIKITNKVELTPEVITDGYMQFAATIDPRTQMAGAKLNAIQVLVSEDGGNTATRTNSLTWNCNLYADVFRLTEEVKDVEVENDSELGNDADDYYWAKYEVNVNCEEEDLRTLQANGFKVSFMPASGAEVYSINGNKDITMDGYYAVEYFNVDEWNYTQNVGSKSFSVVVKYPKSIFDGKQVQNISKLDVQYIDSDEYSYISDVTINHELHDYNVKYDGDLFAVQTDRNPGYEISWNSLNRGEASPFSFYISGLSRYNGEYSATFEDDHLEILTTNGTFKRLENHEYQFNRVIINDLTHFTDSVGEQYTSLDFAVVDGDFNVIQRGSVGNNSQTIVLPEGLSHIGVIFGDLHKSLYLDATAIQVVGVIDVDDASSVMKEGELRNLVGLTVLNNKDKVMNVVDASNYTGSDGERLANADMDEYGMYIQRDYATQIVTYKASQINVTATYNPSKSVYNEDTTKQESKLDIEAFFAAPGEVDSFSLYSVLPEGMKASKSIEYSAESTLYLADGTQISPSNADNFLSQYAVVTLKEDYKGTGRDYMAIDFNFPEGKEVCYDATMTNGFTSGKITASVPVEVDNKDATYKTVVGMMFHDEHHETITKTKDNGSASLVSGDSVVWTDINNNGNVDEIIDYATATLTAVYVKAENKPAPPEEPEKTPSVSITKTADKDVYKRGETIVYTIEVTNNGETDLHDIVVTENGTIIYRNDVTANTLSGKFVAQKGITIEDDEATIPELAIGESIQLIYKVYVTTDVENGDEAWNEASVTTEENVTDEDEVTVEIEVPEEPPVNKPSIKITKTANKAVYKNGEDIIYHIVVTNNGNVALHNISVEDIMEGKIIIPDGSEDLSDESFIGNGIMISGMAVGTSEEFYLIIPVPANSKNGDTVYNSVKVTSEEGVEDEDDVTVRIEVPEEEPPVEPEKTPSVKIEKTADKKIYKNGETIIYTITVTNNGETALHNVVITDELDGIFDETKDATIDKNMATIAELAIGKSVELMYRVNVPEGSLDGDEVLNIVNVTTDEEVEDKDEVVVEIEVTEIPVNEPAVRIEKTADKKVYKNGETIIYTITVTNTGNVDLHNVVVTDKQNGSFDEISNIETDKNVATISSLAVDEKVVLTYRMDVPANSKDGEKILNEVEVTTDEDVSDEDEVTVEVEVPETPVISERNPSIKIEKTADKETYKVKETITYTIKVTNTGNVNLTNVKVTESMDGDFDLKNVAILTVDGKTVNIGTLAVGESKTFTFKAIVPANAKNNEKIRNTVKVTTDEDVTDKDTVDVKVKVPEEKKDKPSLDITKTANKTTYNPGETITYTIKVKNDGNITLEDIDVIETLSGTWSNLSGNVRVKDSMTVVIDKLKAGESETMTFTFKISDDAKGNTSIKNIVKAKEYDYDLNDSDDITVQIIEKERPEISIEKTASRQTVKAGEGIQYVIVVKNTGNVDLKNVSVIDALTDGKFDDFTGVTMVNDYSLIIPELKVGESKTFTFQYQVPVGTTAKEIVNTVTAIEVNHNLRVEDKATITLNKPLTQTFRDIVQTGDNAPLMMFFGLALISLIGMCIITFSSRKKN